jgi:4a-hydroxytetrahydrobiopterin dehydratase
MPDIAPLSAAERAGALADLTAWTYDEERRALCRKLVLPDFAAAMGLMMQIAVHADRADHHPEWSNVYNRLDIWLTTHDAGGVSHRDVALAQVIDRCVASA